MVEQLKPKRKYPLKALTNEVASKLHEVGGKLPGSTLLDDLYGYDSLNWAVPRIPPPEWTEAMKELTRPQRGAVTAALTAARNSKLRRVDQLRVPFEQLLHTDWTFGRNRIEFLQKVFTSNEPEIPKA